MLHILGFFSLQDAVYFIMLSFLVPVIITFYNTGCAKILKKIPAIKECLSQDCVMRQKTQCLLKILTTSKNQ